MHHYMLVPRLRCLLLQNVLFWDWLLGTLRKDGGTYGESVYVGDQNSKPSAACALDSKSKSS